MYIYNINKKDKSDVINGFKICSPQKKKIDENL